METFQLNKDIPVICITASSFPDGIMDAFHQLHQLLGTAEGRTFYGISYMGEGGKIVYKAAAEELKDNEAAILGCESYLIKKGTYISHQINDFMKNVTAISNTFQSMLVDPRIDRNGACIEWYLNEKDVICMVRLQD